MRIAGRDIEVRPKALILPRARSSERADVLAAGRLMTQQFRNRVATTRGTTVVARLPRDPFGLVSRAPGVDVTVELCADAEATAFAHAVEGLASLVPGDQVGQSAAILVGHDYVFRPCPPQRIRFQYVMRRRSDLSHEAYVRHYAEVHSKFGFATRGVRGYAQFHVNPTASALAAHATGFTECDIDGVSQLSMPSLVPFLLASPLNGARGMVKDEKRFVQRSRSTMFTSAVISCSS